MIFRNSSGAPELGCNHCGCRWYDRITNSCYECGRPVTPEDLAEFEKAYEEHFGRSVCDDTRNVKSKA